jgi:hypothetical protein
MYIERERERQTDRQTERQREVYKCEDGGNAGTRSNYRALDWCSKV